MSAISASIQLNDRMSPVLVSITSAMNMMVSSFGAAQTASETAINTAQWEAAVQQVQSASAAVEQYQEELERVQNKPVSVPDVYKRQSQGCSDRGLTGISILSKWLRPVSCPPT